ncbi:MAG TPA: TonB family protein [Bacteroidetes bacterium]|nr:TonB family protein [Bacteroidota bacterium]
MKQYLIISSAYLSVFYVVYILLLSKDTRYLRNRIYLLASIIISLFLPLARITASPGGLIASFNEGLVSIIQIPQVNVYADDQGVKQTFNLSLPFLIYLTGSIVTFLILMFNLIRLSLYIRKYRVKGSRVVLTPPGRESGFSAMGYIFLNNELEDQIKNTILDHEKQHIRNKHFFDIILLRSIGIFLWFNPFIYLYERSLKALHEFEADQQMLDSGRNVISYQRLLLNQVFNTSIFTLQNGFSGPSLIKKRMIMMTKRKSKKTSGLKLLLAMPLILFVFAYFSCTSDENNLPANINETETLEPVVKAEDQELKTPREIWKENPALQKSAKSAEDLVFVVVEDMPTFRGGDVNFFREWVQRNVKYPAEAVKEGIQGKVFIMFVVNEDGYVSDVEILRGVHPSLDEEAVRVVNSSPVWSPGFQRDIPVKVKFSITVNFQLQ